jgi:AbrB family looped-hinge helix DNA binding protein
MSAPAKAHARVTINKQGRIVIPVALRKALGVKPGDELVARVKDGQLVLETRDALLDRIQARFAHIPRERSLVDELIAERREQAQREAEEMAEWLRAHPAEPS